MKRHPLAVLALLAAASLACSVNLDLPNINIPRIETGPTQTLAVSEPAPEDAQVVDLTINMAAGELNLTGGASQLVEGEIRYNVADWAPTINSGPSSVEITQGDNDTQIGVPLGDSIVNEWDLQLGDETPLNLELNSGAYQGTVDLSGVPLRNLSIDDGASDAQVRFDSLNPEEMDSLDYNTGASSVRLFGLANANFASMSFNGGAGSYELDFSGTLQRDATVNVTAGVSSLRIVVPVGTAARVNVNSSVSNVTSEGGWTQRGDTYEAAGSGPTLVNR